MALRDRLERALAWLPGHAASVLGVCVLGAALALAAEGIRRLRIAEGSVSLNLWLHAAGHWHIEVMPRFTILAGVELGSGYYVNTMAPESAAGVLREA